MSYWDTSAIIPLTLEQPFSDQLRSQYELSLRKIVAWWATLVECHSGINRLRRMKVINRDEEAAALLLLSAIIDNWEEVRAENEVREEAILIVDRHSLKAADALQLAAALTWANHMPHGKRFVSLDDRLREAARNEGFSLFPEKLENV